MRRRRPNAVNAVRSTTGTAQNWGALWKQGSEDSEAWASWSGLDIFRPVALPNGKVRRPTLT